MDLPTSCTRKSHTSSSQLVCSSCYCSFIIYCLVDWKRIRMYGPEEDALQHHSVINQAVAHNTFSHSSVHAAQSSSCCCFFIIFGWQKYNQHACVQRKEDDAPVIYQETANAHTAATQLILLFVISYYYCFICWVYYLTYYFCYLFLNPCPSS